MLLVALLHQAGHHVGLVDVGLRLQQQHVASCHGLLVLRGGQQGGLYAQLVLGVAVEDVEQILGRAVVLVEVVEVVVAAALTEQAEGVGLGAHKGENGLLGIAEVDHGGIGGGEAVDDGQLKRVQVLHLVHLQPAEAVGCRMRRGRIIRDEKEVLEVKEVVLLLVALVLAGGI